MEAIIRARTLVSIYRHAAEALGAACMAGIVILTALQIVSRYALQASLFWPEEAARFLLITITFVIAGLSYERGEMLGVTVVADMFGKRVALVLAILAQALMLALLAVMIRYGWSFAQMNAIQSAAALRISMFWVYLTVPVGLGLLALHILAKMLMRLGELLDLRKGAA